MRCDSFPIMAWFGWGFAVVTGVWVGRGRVGSVEVFLCMCVFGGVMTSLSLSLHAPIFFCCVYWLRLPLTADLQLLPNIFFNIFPPPFLKEKLN